MSGASALARGRAAGDQPAAADADEQHVERAGLLEQLERDRALPGHHALVVVGVDRDEPALGDQLGEQLLAVGGVAVEARSPRRRSRAVAASLPGGASSGIRIVGRHARAARAASASACAWLPEETVATPRGALLARRATRPRCRRRGT